MQENILYLNIKGEIAETNQYGDGTRYVVILGNANDCYKASTDEIFSSIKENPFLHDVTFLAEEPFENARALAELSQKLHEIKLNVIVDTSYTLKDLLKKAKADSETLAFLKEIDILIDGTFEKSNDANEVSKGITDMKTIDL